MPDASSPSSSVSTFKNAVLKKLSKRKKAAWVQQPFVSGLPRIPFDTPAQTSFQHRQLTAADGPLMLATQFEESWARLLFLFFSAFPLNCGFYFFLYGLFEKATNHGINTAG